MNHAALTIRVRVALLLVIALLVGFIAVELFWPSTRASGTGGDLLPEDIAVTPQTGERYLSPSMGDFVDVLERPLFFADRTLPAEPEPAAAAPLLPLRLTLEGVAISSGSRVAVLRNPGNNQLLQLAEGKSHDGWLLDRVSADRAVFKRGEQVTELLLEANSRR